MISKIKLLAIPFLVAGGTFISGWGDDCKRGMKTPLAVGDIITKIYWSDGDSGKANGVCFRLSEIEAPSIGEVGTRGGAACQEERELGYGAKKFVLRHTKDKKLTVSGEYGIDSYDRQLIHISVEETDLNQIAIRQGPHKSWPLKSNGRLSTRPKFCS